MDTKKILKNVFITIIFVMMIIVFSSTKCKHFEPTYIQFELQNNIKNKMKDKIHVEFVMNGENKGFVFPYFSENHIKFLHNIYSDELFSELKEAPVDDLSWDEAMQLLKNNIDSVRITRKSDSKSVLFCHGDNSTEQERFFFTQDAWSICDEYYSAYGLSSRDYIFVITDELFE